MESCSLIGRELIYAKIDLILFEQIVAKDAALATKDAELLVNKTALAAKDAALHLQDNLMSQYLAADLLPLTFSSPLRIRGPRFLE
jgi:hypothetical protein